MQDGLGNDLLHLGNLAFPCLPRQTINDVAAWREDGQMTAFPEDTSIDHHGLHSAAAAQRILSEEDSIILKQLAFTEVQEWCLSKIIEYQNHNRFLRQCYGPAARNALSKHKAYIRALRSVYNEAVPINQFLPPEMLMEVFSHVHPAVMPRSRIPVLRVCRYWRRLLFRTSQFWANLLSLPTWEAWNPGNGIGRFQAALARSAPEKLIVSVPYSDQVIAGILLPHASRLSSLKVGPTMQSVEEMAQVLEQRMPHLTHLTILHCWRYTKTSTFDLKFRRYPNIQTLELERARFYTPAVPYVSLCHLKLKYSTIRPLPAPGNTNIPPLRAMHNALEFFPNLETLSLTRSLMDDDPRARLRPPCALTKSVPLPRLRRLEIEDIPAYIPHFLSHLVFPTTTSLVLGPEYRLYYSLRPTTPVPLFPEIAGSPGFRSPTAELSLHLDLRGLQYYRVAGWETRGDGVRPVRINLLGAASDVAVVGRFTRELAAALAPALGVTSLVVEGTPYRARWYWERLLRDHPGLRHFSCQRMWSTKLKELVGVLGMPQPESLGGEFPCARLEELVLGWGLPNGIRDSVRGREERRLLQQDEGQHSESELESLLAASLSEFCDTLRVCFTERAGHCALIRRLSVSLHWDDRRNSPKSVTVLEEWQVALVEERLRHTLGHLVGDIAVRSEVN